MKARTFLLFVCLGGAWAQDAAKAPPQQTLPDLPDDAVVAVFDDGVKFTMGDFKGLIAILPPQTQQLAIQNRRMFVEQWALMRKLAKLAEAHKLDQNSPTKEQLIYDRLNILSNAEMVQAINGSVAKPEEVEKYYAGHRDDYKEVKVKAIYVAFGDAAEGKKALTEEQAKAKAAKLLAEIRGGADFVKLVKENSDDQTSREKDGDFATLHAKDNIPDAIRTAVFALKKGEVTDPVRQSSGFYLLRAEDVTYRPLEQVRDEVFSLVRNEQARKWMEDQKNSLKVEFPLAAFTTQSVTIPLQIPPPPK